MATRSLSPNRALERMRQYHHAVMVLVMQRAKRSVLVQIQGLKPQHYCAKEIAVLAEAATLSATKMKMSTSLTGWLSLSYQVKATNDAKYSLCRKRSCVGALMTPSTEKVAGFVFTN
jgi:hypothetical protein